jgi:hypothetical protein
MIVSRMMPGDDLKKGFGRFSELK